ncbi:MAG: Transcriptional regulatory protein ZraR [bacterium]|nr:Transcriptional regulatory protein ZraR [bacterium]
MSHVLIIEDDPNTLSGLQDLLQQEGYRVNGVTRGRQAIQTILAMSIDIVICDYSLPDMNGLQVCHQLRHLQPELQLFLVTAYSNHEIMAAAKECCVTNIFHKPLDVEELLDKLAALSTWRNHSGEHLALA